MRCDQRLVPPLRAQRRKMLRDAPERLTIKRVGRAVVDVSAQHQFCVRCGQRREVEQT
jgi:NADH pyrophosphatase NudC (nudix superfamily)